MILTAGKYTDVRTPSAERGGRNSVQTPGRAPAAPRLFLPTLHGKADCLRDWFWKEIKDGGYLSNYLQREKACTPQSIRRVARLMSGFQQNNKSDFRRLAAIPAKLYHRWKNEDEQFFEDDNNLRSLKRDNPDLPIYVGPRALPSTRTRKVYQPSTQTTLNPQLTQ